MKSMEEREPANAFPTKVLLVEDSAGDASLIMSALGETINFFDVQWVSSLAEATTELLNTHYECLLVDLGLPDGDGLQVVDTLRDAASDSALVVLTGRTDGEQGLLAIQHGADDYFLKSELSARGLHRSISYAIERTRAKVAAHFQAALLGAVGQPVVATDPDGLILYWNRAAEVNLGWSEAEVLNRPTSEFVASETRAQADEIMAAISAGASWTGDFLMNRRDGSTFPALLTNTPMFDENGELRAIIGVSIDISERKRAEETARELSAIVESTADSILTIDLDGTILTWNRGAQDLYGYSAEEAIGKDMSLLDADAATDERLSAMTIISTGESIRDMELVRRRRDGSLVDVSLTGSPIYGDDGNVMGIASIGRDIGDRKRLEQELSHQAVHDSLTGLPNRTLLADRLSQALAGATRRDAPVSVLFLDLDQFKSVNDTHGHLVGDDLLVEVSERLKGAIRPSDTLARFGGDEFVVVCEDADVTEAQCIAERLAATLKHPIEVDGSLHYLSASIGIAVSPPLEADPHALLRYADTAMYDAKARGRARSRVYDKSLATQSKETMALTNDLRDALRTEALEVHYQPVLELATGRVIGLEALARWHHPIRGWVPPTVFVPLAEESGLIAAFDQWVLNRACLDGAELRVLGLLPPDALLSVNISARNVGDLDLVDTVREVAANTGFPLESLELEVTETAIMAEVPTIRAVLEGIRDLGVGIALDDFGTGYSSLTFVRQLPVTTIKIDRSFIRNVTDHRDDRAICSSVIDLARAVGLRTIAEGVETLEQLSMLHRLGCDAGQGYLWSSAIPLRDLVARLRCEPQDFAFAAKVSRWRSGDLYGSDRAGQKQRRKAARVA